MHRNKVQARISFRQFGSGGIEEIARCRRRDYKFDMSALKAVGMVTCIESRLVLPDRGVRVSVKETALVIAKALIFL